jgi:hypothetical protein
VISAPNWLFWLLLQLVGFKVLRFQKSEDEQNNDGPHGFSSWECTKATDKVKNDPSFPWLEEAVQHLVDAYRALWGHLSSERELDRRVGLIDDVYRLSRRLGRRKSIPREVAVRQEGDSTVLSCSELMSSLLGIVVAASGADPPRIPDKGKIDRWDIHLADEVVTINFTIRKAKPERGREAQVRVFEVSSGLFEWMRFLVKSKGEIGG